MIFIMNGFVGYKLPMHDFDSSFVFLWISFWIDASIVCLQERDIFLISSIKGDSLSY